MSRWLQGLTIPNTTIPQVSFDDAPGIVQSRPVHPYVPTVTRLAGLSYFHYVRACTQEET
ncbi:hypothetical protein [Streptomyces niveus]|uniref:Uncharacterized protein n=1 Tax=Streptomyces niveus TaxID=193462 RepID=A0ABZ2AJY5_STRNV|nr:hypothetical protein [Streptomyces niveus]WTA64352.1 hypothetical protein OG211_05980 [Streptomyces niveus]